MPVLDSQRLISLCMIARDDGYELDRCLSSCQGLPDEIIVVDTGSLDKTKEVALKHEAKILDFIWIDDFAAARNFSFKQATCPWIMWLDADDVIRPEELDKFLKLKAELPTSTRQSYILKYELGRGHSNHHRIVRNSPNVWWEFPFHEVLLFKEYDFEFRDICVDHHKIKPASPEKGFQTLKKACEGAYKEHPRMLYYLAREYAYRGLYEAVVGVIERYSTNIPFWLKAGSYYYLAEAYFRTGQPDKGLELCFKAIQEEPQYAEFYCLMGDYYYGCENIAEAKKWYERTLDLKFPENSWEIFMDRNNYGPKGRAMLKIIAQPDNYTDFFPGTPAML